MAEASPRNSPRRRKPLFTDVAKEFEESLLNSVLPGITSSEAWYVAVGIDMAAQEGNWGVSLGSTFGDAPVGEIGADVPYMDEDGTGPAMDLTAGPGEGAELDGVAEPVPAQLASTGGRWRSRSAG